MIQASGSLPQPVQIIRNMPGGSQARLIVADDGRQYIVKFKNNPQQRRTLINEVIATEILAALGLPVPNWRPVLFSSARLSAQPIALQFGTRNVPVTAGLHFGSEYCGGSRPVYDWLPHSLLRGGKLLAAFLGMYVADQWMANTDQRQAVFCRRKNQQWLVHFIDHGHMFNGPLWEFRNTSGWGLYSDRSVYGGARSLDDLEPWIDRIRGLREDTFFSAESAVPPDWIEGDGAALRIVLEKLIARRIKLREIVRRATHSPNATFETSVGLSASKKGASPATF